MELNPDQFLYHVAPVEARGSIQSHGLRPGASGAVWFFSDRQKAASGQGSGDMWRARASDVPGLEHGSAWSAEWNPSDPVHATGSKRVKVQRTKRPAPR